MRWMLSLFLALAVLGCTPKPVAQAPAGAPGVLPPPGVVDGATAQRLVQERGAVVLDVRTAEEFAQGHVPGARNIPFDQVERRAAELGPPETPLVVYCHSGRRSGLAVQSLHRLGYTQVWDAQRFADWPRP